jgi:HEPN domain-containing protein
MFVKGLKSPYFKVIRLAYRRTYRFESPCKVVSTTIHESFLEAAESDLEAAKAMAKVGLFLQTLYLIDQSLEKSTKSLYAYYLPNHDHMSEEGIYAIIKKEMGHDNWKTIPEICIKICDIESAWWANMHSHDSRVQNIALKAQQQISNLRQKEVDLKNKIRKEKSTPSTETNLVKNFPHEICKIYDKYKNLDRTIEVKTKKALKQLNFTGTENATKPHPFNIFFALSDDLVFCMMIRNETYRYPILERHQNRNLQMLNRPKMKEPCKQLIEIMETYITTIKLLKKEGELAL